MNIFIGNKKVGTSLVSVKQKVKRVSGISADSIIEVRYKKGKIIKYKIITRSVDTKRSKGNTRVNFQLVK